MRRGRATRSAKALDGSYNIMLEGHSDDPKDNSHGTFSEEVP